MSSKPDKTALFDVMSNGTVVKSVSSRDIAAMPMDASGSRILRLEKR